MATWTGCIVETGGRADFWKVAAKLDVVGTTADVPPYVLVECNDFVRPLSLARELSKALSAMAIGFIAQTTADVYQTHAYVSGACVRRLEYSAENDGWLVVDGSPQPWEAAYFFGTSDDLDEDVAETDVQAYERARAANDPTPIIRLVRVSTTEPLIRVCEHFGLASDEPGARWVKPSLWSRVFGRR